MGNFGSKGRPSTAGDPPPYPEPLVQPHSTTALIMTDNIRIVMRGGDPDKYDPRYAKTDKKRAEIAAHQQKLVDKERRRVEKENSKISKRNNKNLERWSKYQEGIAHAAQANMIPRHDAGPSHHSEPVAGPSVVVQKQYGRGPGKS